MKRPEWAFFCGGPTIPLPLMPALGYRGVPKGKNWSYGVAALIFAAIEYKRCLGSEDASV